MTRKFIIISAILILVVSPIIALGGSYAQYERDAQVDMPDTKVQPASKEELLRVAATEGKHEHANQDESDVRILEIVSYEHLHEWWYVVVVRYASYGIENPNPAPMLIAKYHNKNGGIQVVTNPGEPLPLYNISDSLGVPYDVIDKYNNALLNSAPDTERED